ncbi:hypothetical protein IFR05_004629 [Cadophora sp. M221]|nr:hypothetical protein IFR05_004629 [Cadophora sp. M221]
MADPVSAGAGIVGVIGLAIQITQLVVQFGIDWKDVPDNVKAFMAELGTLKTVLSETNTNIILNPEFEAAFQNRPSLLLSQLGPNAPPTTDTNLMLEICRRELETVLKELRKSGQSHRLGWERLKAAFRAKDTRDSVENLCRQCQTLNNMVSIDTAVLGATTYKEVREARKEQQEISLVIRGGVDESNKRQENQEQQHERQAVLDWLTPIDYTAQQCDLIGRRQEGTGEWLLDSAQFQAWSEADTQTLFCPGIPGAGKTILTSVVVDKLTSMVSNDSTIGIAYIYCNFRRQNEQNIDGLLRSLLKQLVEGQPSLPGSVRDLYDLHQKKRTQPSLDEISRSLRAVVGLYSRAFIIIDALDECQTADGCRENLLSRLFDLQGKCKMNLFATSRPISSIEKAFEGKPVLEIRASENDVRRYLHGHMFRLPSFVKRNLGLQEEIETEMIKVVDGMFLLAQLHLDSLTGKKSPKTLRATLKTMARGSGAYDSAYNEAMERINGQIKDQEELAKQVLSWITCAKRPLATTELQCALGVEVGESGLDEENLPDIEDMVSACAGLVTIDEESNIIRLVHYTTQEYFERTQQRWFPNAQASITDICVSYLSFDEFESGICQNDYDFEQRLELNKFYDYASHNWGHHARESSILCQGLMDFLQKQGPVEASSQALMIVDRWSRYSQRFPRQMTGLHLAASFGLEGVVQFLISSHNLDLQDSYSRTPLLYAVMSGHEAVVQLMLEKSADVNTANKYQETPLHLASRKGHVEVVQLLLEKSADVNATDNDEETPLHRASWNGHIEVVQLLLLKKSADVNATNEDGETPLHLASENGHVEVVQLLLEKSADVNATDENEETPLHLASRNGHVEVVQLLLLEKSADVNAINDDGETPLHLASRNGHVEVVQLLLLEKSADVNAINDDGETPLHLTSGNGHTEVVQLLLLEKSANVNATDKNGETPLHRASRMGHVEVVQLLQKKANKSLR